MKKSKALQLVLITAALASCNRQIIPSYEPDLSTVDPTMMTAPDTAYADEDPGYGIYPESDSLYDYYPYYEPYNLNLNINLDWLLRLSPNYSFVPGRVYRKGAFWRNRVFVARGGFGKTAFSTVAS